jgi:3'(2'), 5'-bisphosphate nucleotidase
MGPTNDRRAAAFAAVASACDVARDVQRDLARVQRLTKDDKSPVTVADFAVQAVVALALHDQLGPCMIVGEEQSQALRAIEQRPVLDAVVQAVHQWRPGIATDDVLRAIDRCDHDATADSYWTLDPIDGTKGFLRGQQYAIALAHIERGEVTLGVMGCPNLSVDHGSSLEAADVKGAIYTAERGTGAWEQAGTMALAGTCRRIGAATFDAPRAIRVCESVEVAHSRHDDVERVIELAGGKDAAQSARLDSQCKYAVVARGQADAYLRMPTKKGYVEKIWDHAAGMLIAQEAGAIVTDITGAPLDFSCGRSLQANRGIVCAAAGLHARLIDAIAHLRIGAPA